VAFLAGLIGKWLQWSEAEIQQLVVAGMLHDIGKMRIPIDILAKPGKLLPEEINVMKQHPAFGYEILQEAAVVDEIIKQGVLQHHERFDKSGYPDSLQESDISQIAKVIAVADVYDAMISTRVYRKAMSPIAVLHEIYTQMFVKLDLRICSMFIQYAKQSLIGSLVKLSNGLVAKIIYLHSDGFIEPIVQMMTGQYIALEEVPGIQIEEFIC
jgi:HD-GYP domain-containing protein (c-di-GMP phosphodiesterase class II)